MENKKRQKAETLRRNKIKGKAGELEARVMANLRGYEVQKRPDNPGGPDFELTRRHPLTREVIEKKTMEVKTGRSPVRKGQADADEVYRTTAFPFNLMAKKKR